MSKCTFCQTRLAKGQIRSYRIGDIVRQIRHDVIDGCKEIWLTSTDNGCYGKDIGSDLVQLFKSCCKEDASYKLRVGMMNPMHLPPLLDELLEVYRTNDKIFKFLYIPVQSGSDIILRKMKRGHSVKIYRDVVKAFRSKIPELTIATDVIVGFPSETDEDFEKTLSLIKETEPDVVNSSKYSVRPNTSAPKLKHLSTEIIKKRTQKLHFLINQISRRRNSIWKGWDGELIIDHIDNNIVEGRNYAYKPVVISSISPSSFDQHLVLGAKVKARIESYSNNSNSWLNPSSHKLRSFAQTSANAIRTSLKDYDTIIVIANLAGTAGTAIAPIVCREAKLSAADNVLSFAIMPFKFEKNRIFQAGVSLKRVRDLSNATIIDNDALLDNNPELSSEECYEITNASVYELISSISKGY